MSVYVRRDAGILTGYCLDCGEQNRQPDKGIGRANLAAWRTQHQHADAPHAGLSAPLSDDDGAPGVPGPSDDERA